MANFNVRVPDDLAARFDAWAGAHGGRSPALRHLIERTSRGATAAQPGAVRLGRRPVKLTVRLAASDAHGLGAAAADMGLTPNAWAAALIRRRLAGRPTFSPAETLALAAMQAELRRIGVNANQIARALNTAVLEGKVLELELAYLDDLRAEVRGHMLALREAFEGNLAYWDAGP
ncbi:plasmid mobilization relaxosome protein MobC [Phenylobacterium sp.]|uniref:plasmid mobilization relaxosome protein MobC n=1 Tax=Phenylobacterium sp. TaxID=1871053 RepID=UPI002896B154|nr:plasmid mobilization relaxosome protein MobC [Phenylobacterium sp.]